MLFVKRFGIGDVYISQGSQKQLRKEIHIDLSSVIEETLRED